MSLPLAVVERLFERLIATYGNEFASNWATSNIANVKSAWAYELAGHANNLGAIAYALENLPERAPNLIAFRNICRTAPQKDAPALERQKADPAIIAMVMQKHAAPVARVDFKEWARVILATPKGRTPTAIQMAKNALEVA